MMKKVSLLLIIFLSAASCTRAQTFSEWFRQKKTQKKYLLQQIAALQLYIGYARKGYNIAKEGLSNIHRLTKGEFDLHWAYFNSLKYVSPAIKCYHRIADIVSLQDKIVKNYNRISHQVLNSKAFSSSELLYMQRVFDRLIKDCNQSMDALILVISSGKLEMKDGERMARIDKVYQDMQEKYTFSQDFSKEAMSLAASRTRDQNDVLFSRKAVGVTN